MKTIKFNKTVCGVEISLNVLDCDSDLNNEFGSEIQQADFFQIAFIKEAKGVLRLNQSEIKLKPNTAIFISKHQQHQWLLESPSPKAIFLVFQEDFLNEFFADQLFSYRLLYFYQTAYPLWLELPVTFFDNSLNQLSEISHELKQPENDSAHIIRALLYYLLMRLNRLYAKQHKIEHSVALDNLAYKFRRSLEENIRQKQRVDDYAELLSVSRVSLNQASKRQFNATASELIKQRLLFEVKNLLLYTGRTLEQIAYDLQISEPQHLSRLFKSKEGVTPTEFRNSWGKREKG
ncbi:hypothetical protein FUAX_18490 [Fulvitalea axinellae]|uniref:HTH araC/xylS-type domain-containing protein n=1 Tax=Fulvitalea axinellae TaxID=1182444 RepID=A0AAU9CN98_9BACT|nr:hypothetical protein FUAX_18490 [Fulvitalea axinellae]